MMRTKSVFAMLASMAMASAVAVPAQAASFIDVNSGTPHADDIGWLADQGVTGGYEDGSFGGSRSVVRQDMAAFLYRLAGKPEYTPDWAKNPFTDVSESSPHAKEVMWLASTGISTGYKNADGAARFDGMAGVQRQDMAAFLHRYASRYPNRVKAVANRDVSFNDVTASTPHQSDIAWLAATGVAQGYADGSFGGSKLVVRQDMAAFLRRLTTGQVPKPSEASSWASVLSKLKTGDFTPIAGKYCRKDGSICIAIGADGKAMASGSQDIYLSPDDHDTAMLHVATYATEGDGWWRVPSDVGAELIGPDSDYRCPSGSGFDTCYNGSTFYPEASITKPADLIYIPAGIPSSKLDGIGGTVPGDGATAGQAKPDSSKPFLKIQSYHMNVPPTDENVLYLVK